MNLQTKEYIHSPHFMANMTKEEINEWYGNKDKTPISKPLPSEPAKKDGKIDNNTLIILGFALVIIILLNRK